ncbi:MAG: glycosyltransferase [Bacteroidia bacterium]
MNNTIILFTYSFPYGKGEQWLESEILYLTKKFKQVYIYPNLTDENKRPLPDNCTVIKVSVKFKAEKKIRYYVLKHLFKVLRYYTYLLITSKNRTYYLKNIISISIDLAILQEEAALYYAAFKNYLKETNVLYFYWCINPVIKFALLKADKKIKHKLVSRAHGYDIDPGQNPLGFYLFRELELKYIDNLVVISKWGATLEKKLYPQFSSKISSCYLGVENDNNLNPSNDTPTFHLVSCSALIELKRVNLIVEILKHIKIPVKWTHIGEGPLLHEIKQQARMLPSNISCEFLGFKSNFFVLHYYKTTSCDLFITTTILEGMPVSIMEAIAHGIPALGTAIAGIPEIVNEHTGFLIAADFNPAEVAEIITQYALTNIEEKTALRKSARMFYEKNFTAEKNFNLFINNYLN